MPAVLVEEEASVAVGDGDAVVTTQARRDVLGAMIPDRFGAVARNRERGPVTAPDSESVPESCARTAFFFTAA